MSIIHGICVYVRLQANVNELDQFGQSPLHIASANGNPELVALLLQHKASGTLVIQTFSSHEAMGSESECKIGCLVSSIFSDVHLARQLGRDAAARGVASRLFAVASAGGTPVT